MALRFILSLLLVPAIGAAVHSMAPMSSGSVARAQPPVATASGTQTAIPTTIPSATPTATPEDCWLKVTGTERFDFAKGEWGAYEGEVLNVKPFERISLRFSYEAKIPKGDSIIFSTQPFAWTQRATDGVPARLSFSPRSIPPDATFIYAVLVVPETEPGSRSDPPKKIVGNQFSIELRWTCERKTGSGSQGKLGTLNFKGIPGPNPGNITGTVTARHHACPHPQGCPTAKPAVACHMTLWQNFGLVGQTVTDKDGKYSFAGLLPGNYVVEATGSCGRGDKREPIYGAQFANRQVKSDESVQADFELHKR